MSVPIAFPTPDTREQDLRTLQNVLPGAVSATVEEIGVSGLAAFFDGYKDSVDLHKRAA